MALYHLIKHYWYYPVTVVVIFLWWVFNRKKMPNPLKAVRTELRVIAAGAEADILRAEIGAQAARSEVEIKYSAEIDRLTRDQMIEAAKLYQDPVALAKYLVRAGS